MPLNVNGGISKIKLSGYKSIKNVELELQNLNVFIGANGSGKSNFISFFKMLSFYLRSPDGLSTFVGQNGGANSLLYFGSGRTNSLDAELNFSTDAGKNSYAVEFGVSIGDKLFFKDERISFSSNKFSSTATPIPLGSGGSGSRLSQISQGDTDFKKYFGTISTIKNIMKKWNFYQFHDTTGDAFIRGSFHKDDCNILKSDGGNLAAFLYMLQNRFPKDFADIVYTFKQIAPYVENLVVEEDYSSPYVRIKWNEDNLKGYSFDVSQMSDGTLRALGLITLLLQPTKPTTICIDEPELGLHPAAIEIICDLIKIASETTQIIISTQSTNLVDCFDAEDVIVVNHTPNGSLFERLEHEKYKFWLEEFTISQTWATNIFGGRP